MTKCRVDRRAGEDIYDRKREVDSKANAARRGCGGQDAEVSALAGN